MGLLRLSGLTGVEKVIFWMRFCGFWGSRVIRVYGRKRVRILFFLAGRIRSQSLWRKLVLLLIMRIDIWMWIFRKLRLLEGFSRLGKMSIL